jgi:hypothetical protein
MLIRVEPNATSCHNTVVEGRTPFVSWLWRTSLRPSGVSWWGERPTWIRHAVYWAIALGVIAATALDVPGDDQPANSSDVGGLAWLVIVGGVVAIMGLVFTLREWEQIGAARNVSRCLVLFTFLLGFVAGVLVFTSQWGLHIEACRTVGELETCQGQATPQQILGMLAWHAANVVPALDITHSLEWPRPARSANAVVGASILVVRLWVAIGIVGVLKRLWDKWGEDRSSPMVSH